MEKVNTNILDLIESRDEKNIKLAAQLLTPEQKKFLKDSHQNVSRKVFFRENSKIHYWDQVVILENMENELKKKQHFKGFFELKNGKIELTTENKNVPFEEHEKGLRLLRDEIDRLLAEKSNCPFYKGSLKPTKKKGGNSCSCSTKKR